jgi:hypothetical protein
MGGNNGIFRSIILHVFQELVVSDSISGWQAKK